jgi:hypothetical protein
MCIDSTIELSFCGYVDLISSLYCRPTDLSLEMAESQARPDVLTLYTAYLSITSYASNTLLGQRGIEAMFYPESVGESHLGDNGRFGRRSRQLELRHQHSSHSA